LTVTQTHDSAPPTTAPLRVLIVEDDPDDVLLCRAAISHSPDLRCELAVAGTLREAVAHLATEGADVALVDLSLPDAQNLEAITTLAQRFDELPLVVLTGLRDEQAAARALHAGAQDYLIKDTSNRENISRAMRYALERKHAEQIRKGKDAAEAANRAKSEFLSRMSHELRTPLTAILGFGQLLELQAGDTQSEYVHHILKAGHHLLGLIDEVLDITRIESGNLALSLEPVRIGDALDQTLPLIGPLAAARNITINETTDAEDLYVMADGRRLDQVLLNLLSNAVKYNRDGGCITVSTIQSTAGRVRVEIRDTGIGLSPEQLALLFTPFDRLGAESSGIEGTGLGLVLSKQFVEAMGGSIGIESTRGVGTTAWTEWNTVTAPTLGQQRMPDRVATATDIEATVLYMEDNLANIDLVENILAYRPRVHLITAMQAHLGLELANQHRPDLILLDLNLPDMPGHEALARLRAEPGTHHTPVIVLSADPTSAASHRLLVAGAHAYLTKPFAVEDLLNAIDTALEREAKQATSP
jgi:signal transduction histidine kinase